MSRRASAAEVLPFGEFVVDDLPDRLGGRLAQAVRGAVLSGPAACRAADRMAPVPVVEDLSADPLVPAGQRHIPGHLAGVAG
jgi:hypothetical protein